MATTKKPAKKAVVKKQAAKKSSAKKVAAKKASSKKEDERGKKLSTVTFDVHEGGVMVKGDANGPQLITIAKVAAKMANERAIESIVNGFTGHKKPVAKKSK